MRALLLFTVLSCASGCALPPPQPAQLRLSNVTLDEAQVQTVVTAAPDCNKSGPGIAASSFTLPLKGTRVIEAAPGAAVCWRYLLPAAPDEKAGMRQWSAWSRAYPDRAPGRSLGTTL